MTMAQKDPDFLMADYAAHAKKVLDGISEFMASKDSSPKFDRKKARDSLRAMAAMIGPGEAADTDPTLEAEERRIKSGQESARGDKRTASDSRYAGPTSPYLGT